MCLPMYRLSPIPPSVQHVSHFFVCTVCLVYISHVHHISYFSLCTACPALIPHYIVSPISSSVLSSLSAALPSVQWCLLLLSPCTYILYPTPPAVQSVFYSSLLHSLSPTHPSCTARLLLLPPVQPVSYSSLCADCLLLLSLCRLSSKPFSVHFVQVLYSRLCYTHSSFYTVGLLLLPQPDSYPTLCTACLVLFHFSCAGWPRMSG
jgi:hypothetical protein